MSHVPLPSPSARRRQYLARVASSSTSRVAAAAALAGSLTFTSSTSAAWARTQAEGMRAALGRGAPFHVERRAADAGAAPAADAEPPFSQPLYVVVPGDCASACLDALDVFTRFPNTRLIGAPSSADSRYMEVRRENLASGLAAVRVPNKMYVNHGRTDGKVYQPDIPVTAVAWTMQSLLEVVERDLAARQAR